MSIQYDYYDHSGEEAMNNNDLAYWERVILSDEADLIPGKSRILYDKAQKYKEACEMLKSLSDKGLLTFKAEDPLRPYSLHCIWIKWNFEDKLPEIPTNIMAEILSKMDTLLIDDDPLVSEWQLSSRLYVMVD